MFQVIETDHPAIYIPMLKLTQKKKNAEGRGFLLFGQTKSILVYLKVALRTVSFEINCHSISRRFSPSQATRYIGKDRGRYKEARNTCSGLIKVSPEFMKQQEKPCNNDCPLLKASQFADSMNQIR